MKLLGWTMSAAALLTLTASAQAGKLGDKAANLEIQEWVKGAAVDISKNDGKQVYVIEFWATWCRPCLASIPHLTELQKKFKDKNVTFISISIEDAKTVKPFVEKQGDKMDYTIALDKNKMTSEAYMGAFGVGGIPHAFVVDQQSRIVWHGHPMSGLDKVVEEVAAGKYDLAAALDTEKAFTLANEYFNAVSSTGNEKKAAELGAKIMTLGATDAQLMNAVSWNIMTGRDVATRDMKLALRAAEAANKASSGKNPMVLDTYSMALFKNNKKSEAIAAQERAIKIAKSDPAYKDAVGELEQRLAEYRE